QTIATPGPPNVEILTVDAGPAGGVNTAFVSVQVCVPGTTTCQTIDHVEVDTGSIGLRILADVPFTLTLPPATNGRGGPPMPVCPGLRWRLRRPESPAGGGVLRLCLAEHLR